MKNSRYPGALLVGMLLGLAPGCGDQTSVESKSSALVSEADGTTSFWRGRNIAEKLTIPGLIGSENDKDEWQKVRISNSILDMAGREPDGIITLSLEQAHPESIQLSFHTAAPGENGANAFDTLSHAPGEPFLSGYVQIVNQKGAERPRVLFSVVRWQRTSIGSWAENVIETGLMSDDNVPPLSYNAYPFKAPLPPSWQ